MVGRFVDWMIVLVALIGLAVTGWWAVYAGPNNAVYVQNTLQEQANSALVEDGHAWANVVMDGQTARLTGASPSYEAQEAALQSLGKPNRMLGGITHISSEVRSASPVSPYIWSAERANNGALLLSGYVPTNEIRNELISKAESIAPGRVTSELKIAPGAPRGEWKEAALFGLMTLEILKQGKSELRDSSFTISGEAANRNIVADVRESVRALAAPFTGTSAVTTGFAWSAVLNEETLILDGPVPTDADRRAILAAAEANFAGVTRDNMLIDSNASSAWRDTVIAALPQFAKFKTGQLSAKSDPAQIRVRGQAYGSVEAFLKQDLSASAVPVDMKLDILQVEAAELSGIDLSASTPTICQQGFDAVMGANTVSFETGSAVIDRLSGLTLDKVMQVANQCGDFNFEIHGHTDSAGNRDNNIALSKARADAVKLYMINRDLAAERIEIVGFGPDDPVADNTTSIGRAKNRRIEFKIAGER